MNEEISVAASYRFARRISRRSGSNFYRSFWLLPRSKRQAMCSLYAFARITDDIGDCDEPTAIRGRWLEWWRQTIAINLINENQPSTIALPEGPIGEEPKWAARLHQQAREILPALRHASTQYQIPSRYLLEIIDGVLADQQKTRFDTYEQLEHYCYLVASAVGLACLHIWEFEEPLPYEAAVDCGLAFQLTNVLRDVVEDAKRGRIYLPRQHYEQHGLCEDDILTLRRDDRLRCLIQDEIERAKRLFDSGWRVWDSVHPDGRPMFSMMWRTYRRLLTRIEEDPTRIAIRRITLSQSDRIGIVSQHFWPPSFRRLPVPPVEVGQSPGHAEPKETTRPSR
ncbi:phytoene/squalene synthase family protein [Novipirellula sp.]|uniref:phytoene/squalene synthase family protein n=1 Tax=Novipirellula sp. TaxID=2795430 RepID=UPI0035660866